MWRTVLNAAFALAGLVWIAFDGSPLLTPKHMLTLLVFLLLALAIREPRSKLRR